MGFKPGWVADRDIHNFHVPPSPLNYSWPQPTTILQVTNMSTIAPHPNVLKLLGACMEAPHMVLVTEWVSSDTARSTHLDPLGTRVPA